jgi:transposase InsO family protein
LVDIMVVDEVQRESMGRPWVTIAFDVATRVVLAFILSLNPPSATSVGLALSMAALPKDRWLKDRGLKVRSAPYGLPKTLQEHCPASLRNAVRLQSGILSVMARNTHPLFGPLSSAAKRI